MGIQGKGLACFSINEKTGPLFSCWLFFQLPCFASVTNYKYCTREHSNTWALYVVPRVPTRITPLAGCTLVGFVYLFIFKHSTFSFHKNKCLEYPPYKHFSALPLFADCFLSGELELLTLKDKWMQAMNCRSQPRGCTQWTPRLIIDFVETFL